MLTYFSTGKVIAIGTLTKRKKRRVSNREIAQWCGE